MRCVLFMRCAHVYECHSKACIGSLVGTVPEHREAPDQPVCVAPGNCLQRCDLQPVLGYGHGQGGHAGSASLRSIKGAHHVRGAHHLRNRPAACHVGRSCGGHGQHDPTGAAQCTYVPICILRARQSLTDNMRASAVAQWTDGPYNPSRKRRIAQAAVNGHAKHMTGRV